MLSDLIERLIGLFFFIISVPFLIVLRIGFFLFSKGPFLFMQKRVGKSGEIFTIYKIRSMIRDAESQTRKVIHLNEADGPVFKIRNDPRYTKIGKFLSHTGLDELPQLINVIKGDMSLVGPRPLPVEQARKVPQKFHKRFSVKPGITSSWVVQGSHTLSFHDWMGLDMKDVENQSILYKARILFATVFLVLGQIQKKLLLKD